ncbi:MAG: flippase activity-associated protein Agl23 [Halobacteriaceae archaeon]
MSALRERLPTRDDPVLGGVLLATAVALLARFWTLGFRSAHQDEARAGLRTIEYVQSGSYYYRPIVHGPFLFQVNHLTFEVFGASDFVARAVVALVGGLLPLVAYLFRDRLRGHEVVALAGLLAANPILLYYSRFMRNDVLLAGFALAAVGFAVRALDTDDRRYVYAAAAALALAFTTKENVIVYVGTWVGALALVVDHRVRVARTGTGSAGAALEAYAGDVLARLRAWWRTLALAGVEFLAVVVVFYAPRDPPDVPAAPDVGVGEALANPLRLPELLVGATLGSWESFWGLWVGSGKQDHAYLPFFRSYVDVLVAGAAVVCVFAAVGILVDRYTGDGPRDLVSFAGYWGLASLFIYPLATDIQAAWNAVHTVVPLAVPAAVGIGVVYRRGKRAFVVDDTVGVALAVVVLLLVGAQVAVAAVGPAYLHPQDPGPMVQYGQPDDNHKPMVERLRRVVAANENGVDVVFYGGHFKTQLYRQPYPWYLGTMDANTSHTSFVQDLAERRPPVVIAPSVGSARIAQTAGDINGTLSDYWRSEKLAIVLEIPNNEVWVTVFVHPDYVDEAGVATDAGAPPAAPARRGVSAPAVATRAVAPPG